MGPTESTFQPATIPNAGTMPATLIDDRRGEMREPVMCDLWMIDHQGSTVLRAHCTNMSPSGMCLRVPLGYGVADQQRYELRSHLPGSDQPATFGLIGTRWATVVRTRVRLDQDDDHLEVGVVLDTSPTPLRRVST